jgi:hypothetical protein
LRFKLRDLGFGPFLRLAHLLFPMDAQRFGELVDYHLIEPDFLAAVRAMNDPAKGIC